MSDAAVRVSVSPTDHPWHDELAAAVRRGGGRLVPVEDAEGLVWLAKGGGLSDVLHPGIRWVQLRSAGVEAWIDEVDEARTFTSARGVYAEAVAEHVVALLFAAARCIPDNSRARSWGDAEQRSGRLLRGSTVALIGAGGIGREVIRCLAPFDLRILAVTRSGRQVPGAAASLGPGRLAEVWPAADYVVLAAPATAETHHLVGADELAAMQRSAWLINVARGSLVDTDALVAALRHGAIAGAALDVTDPEPLPDGHPLWTEPRALITPHVANPSGLQLPRLAAHVEANVRRLAAGQPLLGVVDPTAGY